MPAEVSLSLTNSELRHYNINKKRCLPTNGQPLSLVRLWDSRRQIRVLWRLFLMLSERLRITRRQKSTRKNRISSSATPPFRGWVWPPAVWQTPFRYYYNTLIPILQRYILKIARRSFSSAAGFVLPIITPWISLRLPAARLPYPPIPWPHR